MYAAGKFYQKLLAVAGWQQVPLTEAAQAVQRSAFPDAYAKHEPDATLVVNTVSSSVGASGAPLLNCAAAGPWTQPVLAPIVSAFRTAQRPTHNGVDLGAGRGTRIRAAAEGTVTVMRCNIVPASHGCDVDGSPDLQGCGWYVDVEHASAVVTRYCHMLSRPYVEVGQRVAAGQVLGMVGSSGRSSGAHLHYEVHRGGDHSSGVATDPVRFMARMCAPLGLVDGAPPSCKPNEATEFQAPGPDRNNTRPRETQSAHVGDESTARSRMILKSSSHRRVFRSWKEGEPINASLADGDDLGRAAQPGDAGQAGLHSHGHHTDTSIRSPDPQGPVIGYRGYVLARAVD